MDFTRPASSADNASCGASRARTRCPSMGPRKSTEQCGWNCAEDASMRRGARNDDVVWPENSIRRIPTLTKGYISVRNFGICESASAPETPRTTQETPKPWTRRIPPARQPFMTDTRVAAVMTTRLDRAGEVGHCWFIPYGPKTRSAASQGQPRVTSPSETPRFATRRVPRKLRGSNRRRQNRGHGAYLRRASRS